MAGVLLKIGRYLYIIYYLRTMHCTTVLVTNTYHMTVQKRMTIIYQTPGIGHSGLLVKS